MPRFIYSSKKLKVGNRKSSFRKSALSLALGLCIAGGVQAQSTTGSIFGSAPEGATVTITNNSGFNRTITVDESGQYRVSSLPVGSYIVIAKQGGETVGSRNVPVRIGAEANISFSGDAALIENITVVGSNVTPDIDTSLTDSRLVLTSEELRRMPIFPSAENVALLAPGAIAGAGGYFGDFVSFGGAGVTENSYYINGFLSINPINNLGGYDLPFGALAQQETFTGGYGAKYGRSSGGVINQVGQRGSNEFKFGAQTRFEPKGTKALKRNSYYPDQNLPGKYGYQNKEFAGTLNRRRADDTSWRNTYSFYASGSVIDDKLFAFVSLETEEEERQAVPGVNAGALRSTNTEFETSKIYAKFDWNITDNHLLEYTYLGEERDIDGTYSEWDPLTSTRGERLLDAFPDSEKERADYNILNYTGYLTDTLTLTATYGRGDFSFLEEPFLNGNPQINSTNVQDPSILDEFYGGKPVQNRAAGYEGRDAENSTEGLRINLEWQLGNHALSFGIDNVEFEAVGEGTDQLIDRWIYSQAAPDRINKPIIENAIGPDGKLYTVGAPGGEGYFVRNYIYETVADMSMEQEAYYIEDRWQITENFLLSLGLRNDKFINYNSNGDAYLESDNQWAPRFGASWDVFGDASLQLFANAGRYYLAIPNAVAIRGAESATFTNEYFTYTGIAENGAPTGLTALGEIPVSTNLEYGQPVDPKVFAPEDIENMYQDEYILGFQKTLGDNWLYGAKYTFRDLKSGIDDVCDAPRLREALTRQGTDFTTVDIRGCYLFNPGETNTFNLSNLDANRKPDGTYTQITMSPEDWGGMPGLKREYQALDLFIERPFDGRWEARIDYTYSKLQGNHEGQVRSDIGQSDINQTSSWDTVELMEFSDGYLTNDRRHVFKLRGSYALTEELLLSGYTTVQSGVPISCLGFYNIDGPDGQPTDPSGYDSGYHTCFGKGSPPGEETTPWTYSVDVALTYAPGMFDEKLRLSMTVFNLTNEQEPLQIEGVAEVRDSPNVVSNTYDMPLAWQAPRYVALTARYDF
ncbi:MAG: TonB-dependent receptor [Gammaproteobacteria bacterium]|nr:TonB-dependent receptor [Gammaproteobacteria bacterium]